MLAVVSDHIAPPTASESLSERVLRLQNEARAMAREHLGALEQALADVSRLAREVAEGGDAYPIGARELAKRLAEETVVRVQAMDAILSRAALAQR